MIYLRKKRAPTPSFLTPTYINFGGNQAGNPTTPAGSVGDLLVTFGPRASMTPPTIDFGEGDLDGWTLWGAEPHNTISLSLAVYTKIATGTASGDDPVSWSNSTSLRGVFRFSNAAPDVLVFSEGTATTDINWAPQTGMTPQSLVGIGLVAAAGQTAIGTSLLSEGTPLYELGFAQNAQRNNVLAGWAGHSGGLLDTFDPPDSELDTAAGYITAVFTVKGIPA